MDEFREWLELQMAQRLISMLDQNTNREIRHKRLAVYNMLCKVLFQYDGIQGGDSEYCQSEIEHLKNMPYDEYLKTGHWRSTRKRVLSRADFKCELCNSENSLHVHHKTYKNRGQERNADLIVLCAKCHAKFHDKVKGNSS